MLPNLENLRVKIIEECEARKEGASDATSKALHVKRHGGKRRESNRKNERETKTAPQSNRKTKPDRDKGSASGAEKWDTSPETASHRKR